jgi:hypothetical protein
VKKCSGRRPFRIEDEHGWRSVDADDIVSYLVAARVSIIQITAATANSVVIIAMIVESVPSRLSAFHLPTVCLG